MSAAKLQKRHHLDWFVSVESSNNISRADPIHYARGLLSSNLKKSFLLFLVIAQDPFLAFDAIEAYLTLGSVCSTAVERMPSNREVVGLTPPGVGFIFFLCPVKCVFKQVPPAGAALLLSPFKK